MCYRARGIQGSSDYALYIGSEGRKGGPRGAVRDPPGRPEPGRRLACAEGGATIPSVKTLAAQVQAAAENASLEIADITFSERKPTVRLADVFDYRPGGRRRWGSSGR